MKTQALNEEMKSHLWRITRDGCFTVANTELTH